MLDIDAAVAAAADANSAPDISQNQEMRMCGNYIPEFLVVLVILEA